MNITDLGVTPDTGLDQTTAIQVAIGLTKGELNFPAGTYLHTGLTGKDNIALVSRDRTAVLKNVANTTSLNFSGKSRWLVGDGLTLQGTAASWPGQTDLGQRGILSDGCADFTIRGAILRNFSGAALEHKNSVNWWDKNFVEDSVSGNYRGIYAWSYGQFLQLRSLVASFNLWGFLSETGNQIITGGVYVSNSTAIQFRGGPNNGHSTITGTILDHNGYALSLINLDAGLTVEGAQLMCDVSNASNAGFVQIYNSSKILIADSHLAVSFLFDGTDLPAFGSVGNRNGVNRISGCLMRTDIAAMVAPVVQNGAVTPQLKDNFTAAGPWAYNN